ncbi:MAG: DNA repair protein [Christensenellaceae bacterium]|nr:DNA repair protein [Christensenellaceae bacterium]
MENKDKTRHYLVIDLKSFYASVECVERGLDPMTTNLVVADPTRSERTICLAVSPSMKALGVKNRCRVFQIPEGIEYIMAPPRMRKYLEYSAAIYGIYLKYISKDDIHVYSIDEAFIDVTDYLHKYGKTPKEMAVFLMDAIADKTGIRATCGVGTNMYLAKIALDITAKHAPDFIGELDETSYKLTLWDHRPLTDFWRIGPGISSRLNKMGIHTMRELAHADETRLYSEFGIDAELLIDHAYGIEPTTIADIKRYRPRTESISNGQVLMRDYTADEARIIVKEMTDMLCLEMVERNSVTDSVTVSVRYSARYEDPPTKGTAHLDRKTNADSLIIPEVVKAYNKCVLLDRPVRGIIISCNNLTEDTGIYQTSLFDGMNGMSPEKNKSIQKAVIDIKKKFGKNAIIKGISFEEAATGRERNRQIGGHKDGE